MKLSIVVPVYNVEKYLETCVVSLYQQDIDDSEYEVLLVNDGSTDGSRDVAVRLQEQHSNLRLIEQDNQGLSAARNTGLHEAQGRYVMFIDSDDYIAPNSLCGLYKTAEQHDCDILFFGLLLLFEDGSTSFCKTYPRIMRNQVYSGMEFFKRIEDYGGSVKAIYRKSFMTSNKISFTPGISREDCDFGLRVYPIAERIVVTDNPVYYYRKFGESLTRTQNIEKLRYNLFSEFFIVYNVYDFIKGRKISESERAIYNHKLNSMFVGSFMTLLRNRKLYGASFCEKCIDFCIDNKMTPSWGRTNSWKSTIVLQGINLYFLLLKLMRCK